MKWVCLLIFSLLFVVIPVSGQDTGLTVPDLNGLSVPEAASVLSRAGLRLGNELIIAIDPTSGDPENAIVHQSPVAGEAIELGTPVNIGVTRSTNAYLLYDDNDLTLVNANAGLLDLNDLVFSAVGTASPVEFNPSAWAANLDEGRCGQIWSVARLSNKEIEGCSAILWMTASTSSQHFWTYTSGAEQFAVIQDGVVRATCPAAQADSQNAPLRCDFVFDIVYPEEHINYIYIAYTTDRLIIHNQTADRWMEFADTVLRNSGGSDMDLSSLSVFEVADRPARLAPGECILFALNAGAQPPEPCQMIGLMETDAIFWLEPFRVIGRDDYPRVCEPAEPDALMICVMLR